MMLIVVPNAVDMFLVERFSCLVITLLMGKFEASTA